MQTEAGTIRSATAPAALHGWVEHHAAHTPDRTALKSRDQHLAYQTFNAAANRFARRIAPVAPPRSFVATYLDDGVETITAWVAIGKAGSARVPIDTRLPPTGVKSILDQVEIAAWVTDPHNYEAALRLAEGRPVLVIEPDGGGDPEAPDAANLDGPIGPSDPFTLVFTSGSTGIPKGILRTHGDYAIARQRSLETLLLPTDRALSFGSLTASGGMGPIRSALFAGAAVHLLNVNLETAQRIQAWIVDEQVSFLSMFPSLFRAVFGTPPPEPIRNVRLIRLGSEPVLQTDFELFRRSFTPGTQLLNTYATTEVGNITRFIADHDTVVDGATVPVGKPSGETRLIIAGDDLAPLPDGEIGEIVVRTTAREKGYWKTPELTAEKFIVDPVDPAFRFYRTGDLGRILPDGNLVHLGRLDAMIKIRGFRVELLPIENRIRQHPRVAAALVRAISDQGVLRIAAYVAPRAGEPVAEALAAGDLRAFLSEALPDFMIPAQFVFLDALPLLPSGKVNVQALPAPAVDAQATSPETPTEARLLPLLQNILSVGSIRRDDNLFDLGADSLKAMRVVSELHTLYGVAITPAIIYQHPTLERLAAYLDAGHPATSALVALNPYGSKPVLLGVPGAPGNAMNYRHLVAELGPDYPVYAFHHPRHDPQQKRFDTLEALARHYVELALPVIGDRPCALAGLSIGGAIAYEMAQQLTAAGHPPIALILLDTHFTVRNARGGWMDDVDDEADAETRRPRPDSKGLIGRVRSRLYRMRRGLITRAKTLRASPEDRAKARVSRQTRRAARRYVARPCVGAIVYLRSHEDPIRLSRPHRKSEDDWAALTRGGFKIFDIPGPHDDALSQPYVRESARHIRTVLNRDK
ncbi:MAG: AMP-binding protein [Chloroflexi bacterium]|nr:AMP-binding protein [Chloroflexota bacterium]